MSAVLGVLSPAGPYAVGALSVTAYVDDGSGNPDPLYAGCTAVLCQDMRSSVTNNSAKLSGPISAVVDGSGVATFAGVTVVAHSPEFAPGGSTAILQVAIVPPGTWTTHLNDSFTDTDGQMLAAHASGATSGPIVGHVPDSATPFVWTDFAANADIYGNVVRVNIDNSAGAGHIDGTYAWNAATPGDNLVRDCRAAAMVTLDIGASAAASAWNCELGLMPNFLGYNDYECVWNFANSSYWGYYDSPHMISFLTYHGNFKNVGRDMATPATGVSFTYEMRALGNFLFVLVDGTYELGTYNDPYSDTSGAPYMTAAAEGTGAFRYSIDVDDFVMQTFVADPLDPPDPPAPSPRAHMIS